MVNSVQIKDDLFGLKNKLEDIETQLNSQLKDLDEKEEKWKVVDQEVDELIKTQNRVIRLNVGGKKFAVRLDTLVSVKDTLFYKIIMSKKVDLTQEFFFDRSPTVFPIILDYLRYKHVDYKNFSSEQLQFLEKESEYYEVTISKLDNRD